MSVADLARQIVRATGFGVLTAYHGAGVFADVASTRDDERKPAIRDGWSGGWSRALLSLFDVDLEVHGHPGIAGVGRHRGRVVVANHRSIIDIAILLDRFGGAVVARGEIEGWPVIGPAARSAGTIFVNRGSKASGAHAIQAMVDRLNENDTICLFPEGTTYVDDVVRPFKAGAFVAAERAGVPVVPVGLVYPLDSGAAYGGETFVAHLARLAASRGTRAFVEVGDPMEKKPDESVDDFRERVRAEVERLVGVARARERA